MSPPERDGFRYRIYGLDLQVDRPILDIPTSDDCAPVEVVVRCVPIPGWNPRRSADATVVYATPTSAQNGQPHLQVWRRTSDEGTRVGVQYTEDAGDAVFEIDAGGARIDLTWSSRLRSEDLAPFLLGPVLGCLLRVRNTASLHGGVVAVDGRAVVLIGPKGAGKSTLVSAMAGRGVEVLSDDLAPLTPGPGGTVDVQPGYPRLRLWPASVRATTCEPVDALPRVLSHHEKRFVPLSAAAAGVWRFRRDGVPISAIYVLGERRGRRPASIVDVSDPEAFLALLGNVYAPYLLDGDAQRQDLETLGRLVRTTRVARIEAPDELDALPDTCDAILDDVSDPPQRLPARPRSR